MWLIALVMMLALVALILIAWLEQIEREQRSDCAQRRWKLRAQDDERDRGQ